MEGLWRTCQLNERESDVDMDTKLRGTQTHLVVHGKKTSGGTRKKTGRQQKQTCKDISKVGKLDLRRHSFLVDQGRKANQMDYAVMKSVGKAVADSKASSERRSHW